MEVMVLVPTSTIVLLIHIMAPPCQQSARTLPIGIEGGNCTTGHWALMLLQAGPRQAPGNRHGDYSDNCFY